MISGHREGGEGLGVFCAEGSTDASAFLGEGKRVRAQRGHSPVVYTQKCTGQRWGLPTFSVAVTIFIAPPRAPLSVAQSLLEDACKKAPLRDEPCFKHLLHRSHSFSIVPEKHICR